MMNLATTRKRCTALALVVLSLFASACSAEVEFSANDANASAAAEPTVAPASEATTAPTAVADRAGDDLANEPEPTATPAPAPTPTPTPEPEVPVMAGTGGAVERVGGVTLAIGETTAGQTDLDAFLAGRIEENEDQSPWMVTRLTVESEPSFSWTLRTDNFALVDPDGNVYRADELYGAAGNAEYSYSFDGRDARVLRLVFENAPAQPDTTGWDLVVSGGDTIPTLLPLSGSEYNPHYPLPLLDGMESTVRTGNLAGCSGAEFAGLIERARIDIEDRSSQSRYVRVPQGERLVIIHLALTGQAQTSTISNTSNCGLVGLWDPFVLQVDGRPTQAMRTDQPDIEGLATVTIELRYQIPSDATNIALTGGVDGTVLAAWDIDLPVSLGERDAELVPFDASVTAPPARVPGQRPAALATEPLAEGGAAGTMLFVDYEVGSSIATNSSPRAFVKDQPVQDDENRTWVIVDLDIENTSEGRWTTNAENIVLEDPTGRPHQAVELYDRTGEAEYSFTFDGIQFHEVTAAFETDGLVSDPTGWKVVVHNGLNIPLVLPLAGPADESPFPIALNVGEPTQIGTDPFPTCGNGGVADATIADAKLAIEGPTGGNRWHRVNESFRYITIQLDVTNRAPDRPINNCGVFSMWPEFLLDVDGRLTQAFRYDKPSLDEGESGSMVLNFAVPKETQQVSLVAGSGRDAIANWDLKNPSQVLQDLGASAAQGRDNQTLITLDETLLFAFGESTLQRSATAPLNRVANVVNSESSGQIEIIGHTDAIGDDASNQALSLARAEAVAAALEAAGVDPSRLVVTGEGESSPVASNTNDDGSDNPAGRAQNRRVEIFFTPNS